MLAEPFDGSELIWPMILQPKLNGVRAKWDVELQLLITRQGEIISPRVLPHLYKRLAPLKYTLDGELYCHNMPFQEICARVAVHRSIKHKDAESIEFHAFDIISSEPAERRQHTLSLNYYPTVPFHTVNPSNWDELRKTYLLKRYEGVMLRIPHAPYIPARTEALIKWKPWKSTVCKVIGMIEGKGKFAGSLGALIVKSEMPQGWVTFKVGGGSLTDASRQEIWALQKQAIGLGLLIRYRELSVNHTPLQAQFIRLL